MFFYSNYHSELPPHSGRAVPRKYKKTAHRSFIRTAYRQTALLSALICMAGMLLSQGITVHADEMTPEERMKTQRAMTIQSNEVPDWPTGPVVSAESAILIEADTGTTLYAKNVHQRQYPASTTKILTTLIAAEICAMDEIVTFSHDAVFDNPPGSSGIAMDVGQELTMEQCLNAILIRSANEVAFAVAEHISGTSDWSVFAETMNRRAEELGCLNTHFANPNGLPDENHYTTAYDLAMIGRAFFANETLCKITLTRRLEIPASDTIPVSKIENSNMQLIPGGTYAYEYLVGCKTGYTNAARYCLVSCAERDGMKLICVVLKDESPYQYEDTITLFNYGFSNFDKVNVSQAETKYNISGSGMFYGGKDVFGNSRPLLTLNKDDTIILPRNASFEDVNSTISYETESSDQAAIVTYAYRGVDVGRVQIHFNLTAESNPSSDALKAPQGSEEQEESTPLVIFVNVYKIAVALGIAATAAIVLLLVRIFLRNYQFSCKNQRGSRRRGRKRRGNGPRW